MESQKTGKQVKRDKGRMAKRQVDEDWTDGNLDRG